MASRKGKGEEGCRSLSSDLKLCESGCQGGRKQAGKKEKTGYRAALGTTECEYVELEIPEEHHTAGEQGTAYCLRQNDEGPGEHLALSTKLNGLCLDLPPVTGQFCV